MGYRREYDIKKKRMGFRLPLLTAVSFLCFLFLTRVYWPEGFAVLGAGVSACRRFVQAELARAAEAVFSGESAAAAFSGFLDLFQP